MNQTRRTTSGIHVGSATLVMLFSVLCLTIFAVLSVVTAGNAWTLAEKSADATTNYYAADSQAIQIYNQIAADFNGDFDQHFSFPAEFNYISHEISQIEGVNYLNYWIAIDENQQLWVQLSLSQTGQTLQILHWQVEATGTWNADQTLNLWDG